jgi:hypothetical protein
MTWIKGEAVGMKFTPDGTGGGWLEWREVQVRKGFRPKVVQRRIYKEAHKAPVKETA